MSMFGSIGKSVASTRKGNTVFLHVVKTENGRLELPALPAEIKSATLLGGEKVSASQNDGKLLVTLPQLGLLDLVGTFIKLELDRPALELPVLTLDSAKK